MNFSYKTALPLLITFLALMVLIFVANMVLNDKGVNYNVLMGANVLFFVVSFLVFRMQYIAMHHSNPQVFIRSVMAGTMIKMFACIIAVVAYYFAGKTTFNKPAVYISMLIYIIYLVVEVRTIMKLNKTRHA